jgi:SNF2 family DNA or RNA helicase
MNWMRELAKFAPSMKVMLHQGKERLAGGSFLRAAKKCDVVIAGYPLFVKDFRLLSEAGFGALVLDEAQLIKNPDTRMAQSARAFPCLDRVALTGTPFENRVTDIWSIEEFLNAGLLGPRSEFVEDFERPIREGGSAPAMAELKKALAPFLLRRLKNDPEIAAELGAKREIREYCVLSARQRAAYEVALARYSNAPREERGGKGHALALLTELKLVCDGLGGDGEVYGGKVERLVELLESIFDAGESVLVFTQYVKVGERIKALIEKKFSRRVPFLHGGLTPSARDAQIAAFNSAESPTAFVLSLKAGGFGLNLTKATHVIHYDRWWNPAVENQATDRAHRIGQSRTVFVHLFISHGTLEDRIDRILEEKRTIAGELVVSGESFLLKMSDKEFARTVALG